ncbi:UDP-4-amino-4-deoxy-L-arabinose--oxoglutarate aminotransferase [Achromobacter pulmonis]|uniref:DegT/DnrJ/EryC1/StrS family aminotransferase n=1 Tax=Achromobacter pulmonis TaxID=1389932 RepID=UPI001467609B|nr:DegT/DnrJ/EryC1/StrS aminotransferase family protein [Achromobacter pulmonis]CAB3650519.1 UDP-4-amino-4-deoxy-L-arabinose--oxoglutarate aminotransferase [Achromobacter pulmonis]
MMIPHSRPWITDEDCEAITTALRSGMLNEGTATRRLEQWFERAGGGTAVATGSGSQALLLALRAVGVGAGTDVVVPTYVCAEVLGVVESLGAVARLVDIAGDYLISPDAAAAAITPCTRAIIVPYVMGIRATIDPLRVHGVPIIEDLAQWLGPVHAFEGDIQVFSFEATKVVAAGEGGLAHTRSPGLAQRLVDAKRVASSPYKLNLYPLSDLQATLALSQLERLQAVWHRRQLLAQRYLAGLADTPLILPPPRVDQGMYFRFAVQLPDGFEVEHIIAAFARHGVAVRRPVDGLLHHFRPTETAFPMVQSLYDRTLSLPLYPALSDDDQDMVLAAARAIFSHS